VRWVLIETELQ